MQTVTACLIACNAAGTIGRALSSIAPWVQDMIVGVDTRSSDGTAQIARECGARVVHSVWRQSFAHARNEVLSMASTDWVLSIDSDEWMDSAYGLALRDAIRGPGRAYQVTVREVSPFMAGYTYGAIRLFRRHPGVSWRRAVHESVVESLQALPWRPISSPCGLVVNHGGYSSPEVVRAKLRRNRALLGAWLAEHPDDRYAADKLVETDLSLELAGTGQAAPGG